MHLLERRKPSITIRPRMVDDHGLADRVAGWMMADGAVSLWLPVLAAAIGGVAAFATAVIIEEALSRARDKS